MPWRYIIERSLRMVITLFIAVTLIFFATRVLPGDPAEALMGRHISEHGLQILRRQMGLDRPLYVQYLGFLGDVLQGNLGTSLSLGVPISKLLIQVAPFTGIVVLGALAIGALLGIPLGILSAVRRNTLLDYITRIVSLGGISLPGFVIGILLILPFSVYLGWFPLVGGGELDDPFSLLRFAFLPAMAGGLGMTAYLTRLGRSSMLETLGHDYVRTARSKGLREMVVLYRHALRNALLPIVTFIGIYAIVMVGDSIAIEIVFSRPGFGRLILGGINQRDYTMLQSILMIYVAFATIINMLVDLMYSLIDPRIRYGSLERG